MPFNTETGKEAGLKSTRKGLSNKVTLEIKEAFKGIVENNLDNMSDWITEIGNSNPEKAIDILIRLSDFIVPKVSRQEINTTNMIEEFYNMTDQERTQKIIELEKQLNTK